MDFLFDNYLFNLDIGGQAVSLLSCAFCAGVWAINLALRLRKQKPFFGALIVLVLSIIASYGFVYRIINRPEFKSTTTQVTHES